jgi:uncharacterized membrane protein
VVDVAESPDPRENDELRRLRGDVDRLSGELYELNARLRRLEGTESVVSQPVQPASEWQFGVSAVNRIGALTLVIGVIFFFKYAVDNRWLGPWGRVSLGLIAGALLLAAGEWLRARDQRTFAQGIAGCGLGTLFITCYASFAWYHLLSESPATLAMIAVSGLAVALSLRYSHAAIAALGFTGGLLTPILLEDPSASLATSLPFVFLIDVTCVLIAVTRRWWWLAPVVGAEALFATLLLTDKTGREWFTIFALSMAAAHLWAGSTSNSDRRVRDALFATGHGFILAGLLRALHLWAPGEIENVSGSLLLAGYAIAALLWGMRRQSPLARSMGRVLIGIVIAKLYLWDVWFLKRLYRMSAFAAIGVLLLAASWIYSRNRNPE